MLQARTSPATIAVSRNIMLGYIFIRSGAISTGQPEHYLARLSQIERLRAASVAKGMTYSMVQVEKVPIVTSVKSLPILSAMILRASKSQDQIIMDDFRRLLVACPIAERLALIKELYACGRVLWELREGGRSLASFSQDDLSELYGAPTRLNASFSNSASVTRSAKSLKLQTQNARAVSQRTRIQTTDRLARKVKDLANSMKVSGIKPTLSEIANEATRLGMTNSRGNPWTPSSVHRALRRVVDEHGTPESTVE